MSSESGKLQLKVNPKADRDYFPAFRNWKIWQEKKFKKRQWSKRPTLTKKALKIRIKAVQKKKEKKGYLFRGVKN